MSHGQQNKEVLCSSTQTQWAAKQGSMALKQGGLALEHTDSTKFKPMHLLQREGNKVIVKMIEREVTSHEGPRAQTESPNNNCITQKELALGDNPS